MNTRPRKLKQLFAVCAVITLTHVLLIIFDEYTMRLRLSESVLLAIIAALLVTPVVAGTWTILAAVGFLRSGHDGTSERQSRAVFGWAMVVCGCITLSLPAIPFLVAHLSRPRSANLKYNYIAPRADTLNTETTLIAREQIEQQVRAYAPEVNNNESRREYCRQLLEQAGYVAVASESGDVTAIKRGKRKEYMIIGAHYDYCDEGGSQGTLDNLLGCALVADTAATLRDKSTDYTYVFLFYGDEEKGRRLPATASAYVPDADVPIGQADYMLEVDYVADKRSGMLAYNLLKAGYGYRNGGMKFTAYPHPEPPTIHTARDNVDAVDFARAYLCYQSIIWVIEGIERGEGMKPPPVLTFEEPAG